ncbi:class I glutamine amidotransferase-like protein [Ilyonectria sp. MPI-CAGE-AT-0026]|nr:class I glutamine amidotransferase-like protein [Ilyonectria sp. MPI-CAGE-AT-0026]
MHGNVYTDRGGFDAIFQSWLSLGAEAVNQKHRDRESIQVKVTGYDAIKDQVYPDNLNGVDAIVITGSPSAAFNDLPWINRLRLYLQDVFSNHPTIKLLGGCFGHQILSQALLGNQGVLVELSPKGLEIGVCKIQLAPEFAGHFPGLLDGVGEMSCQMFHSDHVNLGSTPLPAPWMNIGSSELCDVQGLYNPGRVLTFQGHPEFDAFIATECVDIYREKWTEKMIVHAIVQIEQDDDRILAAQVAVEFLRS